MIADAFDLQKRNKLCNIRGCGRAPTKKVTILEEDRIRKESRTLATLFLCTEHHETKMPIFITEMNKHRETGKVITKRVQDMGFVTY